MSKIINLPDNFIGKEDAARLESFGGHTLSLGRATRWHWEGGGDGGDAFEIYRGGEDETLAARITRRRDEDAFYAHDQVGGVIASGTLEHVLAELDRYFSRLHGERPDPSA